MDIEARAKDLIYIVDALQFKIGDIKFLFSNLDAELSVSGAEKAGLSDLYNTYLAYTQAKINAEKEQAILHDYYRNNVKWRRISLKNGNGQSLGSVYICPHCDSKSPDDFPYCPHCGRIVGSGYEK